MQVRHMLFWTTLFVIAQARALSLCLRIYGWVVSKYYCECFVCGVQENHQSDCMDSLSSAGHTCTFVL